MEDFSRNAATAAQVATTLHDDMVDKGMHSIDVMVGYMMVVISIKQALGMDDESFNEVQKTVAKFEDFLNERIPTTH